MRNQHNRPPPASTGCTTDGISERPACAQDEYGLTQLYGALSGQTPLPHHTAGGTAASWLAGLRATRHAVLRLRTEGRAA